MAIRQCRKFFAQYPHIKLVESDDTALSAKYIADNNIRGMAAIASKLAAELYGLEILFSGIETSKRNYTRFLILSDKNAQSDVPLGQISKASLVFALPHESGSLAQVLSILSYHGMNLTKVQSSPIVGREWEYMFYVDLIFDDYLRYSQAISAIRPLSRNLEIMGEYRRGDLQNGHK
jgi:prephenate dehydratase